jgi:hypothetical protein
MGFIKSLHIGISRSIKSAVKEALLGLAIIGVGLAVGLFGVSVGGTFGTGLSLIGIVIAIVGALIGGSTFF